MTRRIELYLRESVPAAARQRQMAVLGRLRALADAGSIDDLSVSTWAHRVNETDSVPSPANDIYRAFEQWAADTGVSIGPAFDSHDCHSSFTDLRYRTTVFPVMALAVYDDDDEVLEVYPHSRGGRPLSVLDGVAMLESDDGGLTEPMRRRSA